jgi:mRNA-degrading endonuclease RelE of RelBE toxin-antitoxin system
MEFRIADTFTDGLARLTVDEQKAVKTTAFDLQLDPANPGMQFHRLTKSRDPNFWSVRVSGDLRLIVHKTGGSLLLCYVGHHDDAYSWAERRKIERHPKTGAAQLVEEPKVPAHAHRPEVRVSRLGEPMKLHPGIGRVHLQIEGGGLDRLLLVDGEPRQAVGDGVGDAELHQGTV